MIFYCVVTSLLNAVCSLLLSGAAFFKDRRNPLNATFALLSLAIGVWAGAYFFWQIAPTEFVALMWCRVLSVGAIAIAVAYYHFVRRLVGLKAGWLTWIGYILVAGFSILATTDLLVVGVRPKMMFPFWPEPGRLYPAYLVTFFLYNVLTWVRLVHTYRQATTSRERTQLRWVLGSTFAGIIGGATNFFLWYDIPIPPLGNGLVGVYVAGVGYTIFRLRLIEVDYALVKLVSYALAALPIAMAFPVVFLNAERFVPDPLQRFWAGYLGCAALTLVMLWLSPRLKRRIDALLAVTVLRGRFERREELGDLARRITSMRDDDAIARETVRIVHDVLKVPAVLYLRGGGEALFERREARGFDDGRLPPSMPMEAAVLTWLARTGKPLLLDEVDLALEGDTPRAADRRSLVEFGSATGVALALPIIGDVYFFGALLVGHPARRLGISEHDLGLLDTVCGHIGLSLRARQLERRANQTEKLISLGTLAAGLAHELRNPLVSIQTFASLLSEMPDDDNIPAEFKATVMRDVRRIAGIVENVSAFATNNQITFGWVALDEVVKQAYEIVAADLADAKVAYDLTSERAQPVYANQNQLLQVVINLLHNAGQALRGRERARVAVTVRGVTLEDGRPGSEIAIADNGPGIDPEILPRMFEPFTTTKATGARSGKGGMGLGLAIVKRIIDGHNGLINVRSIPGTGTTFIVTLPCEASQP